MNDFVFVNSENLVFIELKCREYYFFVGKKQISKYYLSEKSGMAVDYLSEKCKFYIFAQLQTTTVNIKWRPDNVYLYHIYI